MPPQTPNQTTQMLNDWIKGELSEENKLFEDIYPFLRDIAHKQLNKAKDSNLNTTLLVNEFYLEMNRKDKIQFQDKNHFYALAARLIRRYILMDFRSNQSLKKGGSLQQITLAGIDAQLEQTEDSIDLLTLDKLLNELEEFDPQSVRIIELRFYAGLKQQEIAEILNISTATLSRIWSFARSWLLNKLK